MTEENKTETKATTTKLPTEELEQVKELFAKILLANASDLCVIAHVLPDGTHEKVLGMRVVVPGQPGMGVVPIGRLLIGDETMMVTLPQEDEVILPVDVCPCTNCLIERAAQGIPDPAYLSKPEKLAGSGVVPLSDAEPPADPAGLS